MWNFGDGSAGLGPNIAHVYKTIGVYTVTLISRNTAGCLDTIIKQVDLKINTGNIFTSNDTNYCAGGTLRLLGDSNAVSNCWSPARYLDSTGIFNPLCTPKSNVTYKYNIVKKAGNLISNGNFSDGDVNFQSDYTYSNVLSTSGYYFITDKPRQWNPAFVNCGDTSFHDTVMVVTGSVIPNTIIWRNDIAVKPQTDYEFSFAAESLTPNDSVLLEISLNNGKVTGELLVPDSTCIRKKFLTTWYSGQSSILSIKIIDLDTSASLNNFALDKFSLKPVYIKTDSLTVHLKSPSAITINNDTTICNGDSTMLAATEPGAVSFHWKPANGLLHPFGQHTLAVPSVTTAYTVTITDSNHCINSDSATINILARPVVSTIADTFVCKGSSLLLQTTITGANIHSWSPAAGLNDSSLISPVTTALTATNYVCTAGNGYCIAADTVAVNVMALPVVSATPDTSACKNGQLQLTASGGILYKWNPAAGLSNAGISNPVASPLGNTKYFVIVTDSNGCSNVDSVTIIVTSAPPVSVLPVSATICPGDSVLLTASGGDSYSWIPVASVSQPDMASTQVSPLATANYKVVVTNNNCRSTDSAFALITVKPKPVTVVSKSNDVDCMLGQANLSASGGVRYLWQPAATLSNAVIYNPVASPFVTTTYHVFATGANNCVAEDSVQVKVITGAAINGYPVPSAFTPNGDGINDCFGIRKWGYVTSLQFNVYDRWGKLVFSSTDAQKCWDGKYKNLQQPPGVYAYIIKGKTICGDVIRKGTVLLIR